MGLSFLGLISVVGSLCTAGLIEDENTRPLLVAGRRVLYKGQSLELAEAALKPLSTRFLTHPLGKTHIRFLFPRTELRDHFRFSSPSAATPVQYVEETGTDTRRWEYTTAGLPDTLIQVTYKLDDANARRVASWKLIRPEKGPLKERAIRSILSACPDSDEAIFRLRLVDAPPLHASTLEGVPLLADLPLDIKGVRSEYISPTCPGYRIELRTHWGCLVGYEVYRVGADVKQSSGVEPAARIYFGFATG